MVALFFDRGAGVNDKNTIGDSALHLALRGGHLGTTQLLLGKGADMLALNHAGTTPAALASARWNPEFAAVLQAEAARRAPQPGETSPGPFLPEQIESGKEMASSESKLWSAATNGQPQEVQRLLAAGVKIDERSLCGETALHGAVRSGFYAIVEQLLKKGAGTKPRIMGGSNDAALHLAVRFGHDAIVALLLDRGAGVNVKNKNGDRALHVAARVGYGAIVEQLLDKGAGVNLTTARGETALHLAVRFGHGAIVRGGPSAILVLLLDRGAGINDKNNDGDNALHFAARKGHLANTKLLLDKGAGVNVKNTTWDTALHLAVRRGDLPTTILLLGKGADLFALNHSVKTPADLASALWNPEFAAALHTEAARRAALRPGKTFPAILDRVH